MLGFKPKPLDVASSAAAAAAGNNLIRILNSIKKQIITLKKEVPILTVNKSRLSKTRILKNILYSTINQINPMLSEEDNLLRKIKRHLELLPILIGNPTPNASIRSTEDIDGIFFHACNNNTNKINKNLNDIDIWLKDFKELIAILQART